MTHEFTNLPAVLEEHGVNWKHVPLPQSYERGIQLIEQCVDADICNEYRNLYDLAGLYYRQMCDKRLEDLARRLYLRAYRRLGQLLGETDARGKKRKTHLKVILSQNEIARRLGLSEKQRATARRLATTPIEMFEKGVETSPPLSIANLTTLGTETAKSSVGAEAPLRITSETAVPWFVARVLESIEGLVPYCNRCEPEIFARAMMGSDKAKQSRYSAGLGLAEQIQKAWLQELKSYGRPKPGPNLRLVDADD